MANLTKEKVYEITMELMRGCEPFDAVTDAEWGKALLFYYTGITDMCQRIVKEMGANNG